MRKSVVLFALIFSVLCAKSTLAGELIRDDTGCWYQEENGTRKTGWFQDEWGSWYCFDDAGYAKSGWFRENGTLYYFREKENTLITGRRFTLEGKLYQFEESGACSELSKRFSGWMLDDVNWYYRLADGTYPQNSWKQINGSWYYFDEAGYRATGQILLNGVVYYLEDNGVMVLNDTRILNGVTYNFDDSGAGTAVWSHKMPLSIPDESEKTEFHKSVDAMADSVLGRIVNDSMSQRQKAEAVYSWIKGNIRYSGYSPVGDWVAAAHDGLKRKRGDCYTYYGTTAELFSRLGIQTIEVIRSTDYNHYWNLVNLDGQWYHFDPCPRSSGEDFCLLTDAQIAYSSAHIFERSLYPPTP